MSNPKSNGSNRNICADKTYLNRRILVYNWYLLDNKFKKTIMKQKLSNNTVRGTKTIMLLEHLDVLERKFRHITNSLVAVGFNIRQIRRTIMSKIKKL